MEGVLQTPVARATLSVEAPGHHTIMSKAVTSSGPLWAPHVSMYR
jgi:hypothetical protein